MDSTSKTSVILTYLTIAKSDMDKAQQFLESVRSLIGNNVKDLSPTDASTVVAKAIDVNNVAVLNTLFDLELPVDKNGPALHHAARDGKLESATFLHEHGCDINIVWPRDYHSARNAVRVASRGGHLPVVRYLVETAGATDHAGAMIWAAKYDRIDIVQYFLDRGVDVNSVSDVDDTLYTALHAAADANTSTIEFLLEKGADCRLRNKNGETAQRLAYKSSARLLLKSAQDTQEAKAREAQESKDREAQEAKAQETRDAKAQILVNKKDGSTIIITMVNGNIFAAYLTNPDGSLTRFENP